MNIDLIREVLGWSALINYGILIFWFLFFSLAHDWLYHFHGKDNIAIIIFADNWQCWRYILQLLSGESVVKGKGAGLSAYASSRN